MPKVNGAILKFIPTDTAAGMIQQGMDYTEPPTEIYEITTAVYARTRITSIIANRAMLRVEFVIDPSVGENAFTFAVPFAILQDGVGDPSLSTRIDCSNAMVFSFTKVYLEFHEVDTDDLLSKIDDAESNSQFYKEACIPGNVIGDNTLLESYDITSIYRSFFADFMYAYTHRGKAPIPDETPQAN